MFLISPNMMKKQITDTTVVKLGNNCGYLLQQWNRKCNERNGARKITNFVGATKTNSPTGDSWATCLPPIGDSFLYIETNSNNHGAKVFISFGRTTYTQ